MILYLSEQSDWFHEEYNQLFMNTVYDDIAFGLRSSKKDEENRLNAQEVAKQLETITLEFVAPSGKDGRMFGSISSKQIVDALKSKHNILIDKRKFLSNDTANVFGTTNCKVELYKGVIGKIRVHVSENK